MLPPGQRRSKLRQEPKSRSFNCRVQCEQVSARYDNAIISYDLSNLKGVDCRYPTYPGCNNLGLNPKGLFCPTEDIRALEPKAGDTDRLEDRHLSKCGSLRNGYFGRAPGCNKVCLS